MRMTKPTRRLLPLLVAHWPRRTRGLLLIPLGAVLLALAPPLAYFAGAASTPPVPYWSLGGNAGTDPGTSFVGTTDAQPLVLRTNNAERLRIDPTGKVGIGTT